MGVGHSHVTFVLLRISFAFNLGLACSPSLSQSSQCHIFSNLVQCANKGGYQNHDPSLYFLFFLLYHTSTYIIKLDHAFTRDQNVFISIYRHPEEISDMEITAKEAGVVQRGGHRETTCELFVYILVRGDVIPGHVVAFFGVV